MLLGGTPIAEALLAGARSHPGPHGKLYFTVDADPSNVVTATAGSLAILRSGTSAWINVDGGLTWLPIAAHVQPVTSGLTVFADVDFREIIPIDIKAAGPGIYNLGGVDFKLLDTIKCLRLDVGHVDGFFIGSQGVSSFNEGYAPGTPDVGPIPRFTVRSLFPNTTVKFGALADQWFWCAFEHGPVVGRGNYAGGVGICVDLVHSTFIDRFKRRSWWGVGFGGIANATFPRRLHTNGSCYTDYAVDPIGVMSIDQEPALASGELQVFVIRVKNGSCLEGYVGQTSGGGMEWPEKSGLSLVYRHEPVYMTGIMYTGVNTGKWVEDPFFEISFFPGVSSNYIQEVFMKLFKLKVEAQLL